MLHYIHHSTHSTKYLMCPRCLFKERQLLSLRCVASPPGRPRLRVMKQFHCPSSFGLRKRSKNDWPLISKVMDLRCRKTSGKQLSFGGTCLEMAFTKSFKRCVRFSHQFLAANLHRFTVGFIIFHVDVVIQKKTVGFGFQTSNLPGAHRQRFFWRRHWTRLDRRRLFSPHRIRQWSDVSSLQPASRGRGEQIIAFRKKSLDPKMHTDLIWFSHNFVHMLFDIW